MVIGRQEPGTSSIVRKQVIAELTSLSTIAGLAPELRPLKTFRLDYCSFPSSFNPFVISLFTSPIDLGKTGLLKVFVDVGGTSVSSTMPKR